MLINVQDNLKQKVEVVVDYCCQELNITYEEMINKKKTSNYVMARMITMYMLRSCIRCDRADGGEKKMSYAKIGRLMGNRDHATVIWANKMIEDILYINQKVNKNTYKKITDIILRGKEKFKRLNYS